MYINDMYNDVLKYSCERFSNNSKPAFTDIEVMTVYLFVMTDMQLFKVKQIHKYAKAHLFSWFPQLPSYVAFNKRINRLSEVFRLLSTSLITEFQPQDCILDTSLLDSMPIITCSGKRKGKVATEITDKGFNSTKGMYYYGLKLHALGFRRPKQLPFPEQFLLTPASENDLNLFKQAWETIRNRTFFGDKIYIDLNFFQNMYKNNNSIILTPIKATKGMPGAVKQRNKAADDLFSTAVSKVRQPIEALFNSKVRSTKGLLVHVFGRIAAAYIFLIFNY
ncbi:MAG: transposase [Bacteroidetes bacterium]|nr:MAG: transposase [Bacteroidota bacterium]